MLSFVIKSFVTQTATKLQDILQVDTNSLFCLSLKHQNFNIIAKQEISDQTLYDSYYAISNLRTINQAELNGIWGFPEFSLEQVEHNLVAFRLCEPKDTDKPVYARASYQLATDYSEEIGKMMQDANACLKKLVPNLNTKVNILDEKAIKPEHYNLKTLHQCCQNLLDKYSLKITRQPDQNNKEHIKQLSELTLRSDKIRPDFNILTHLKQALQIYLNSPAVVYSKYPMIPDDRLGTILITTYLDFAPNFKMVVYCINQHQKNYLKQQIPTITRLNAQAEDLNKILLVSDVLIPDHKLNLEEQHAYGLYYKLAIDLIVMLDTFTHPAITQELMELMIHVSESAIDLLYVLIDKAKMLRMLQFKQI